MSRATLSAALVLATLLVSCRDSRQEAAAGRAAMHDRVTQLNTLFFDGNVIELHAAFSDEMQETLSIDHLSSMHRQVNERFGRPVHVLSVDTDESGIYRAIVQWTKFDSTDELIEVQWILRDDDRVAGFYIRPAATNAPSDPAPAG